MLQFIKQLNKKECYDVQNIEFWNKKSTKCCFGFYGDCVEKKMDCFS